jgi:hypothetical protein
MSHEAAELSNGIERQWGLIADDPLPFDISSSRRSHVYYFAYYNPGNITF